MTDELSPRQVQAVRLAADGLSDVAASRRMNVSSTTYKTHLTQAKVKLGAVNRAHVVAIALRRGIID